MDSRYIVLSRAQQFWRAIGWGGVDIQILFPGARMYNHPHLILASLKSAVFKTKDIIVHQMTTAKNSNHNPHYCESISLWQRSQWFFCFSICNEWIALTNAMRYQCWYWAISYPTRWCLNIDIWVSVLIWVKMRLSAQNRYRQSLYAHQTSVWK